MQESGVCRQVLFNLLANLVAIHVYGQVPFFSELFCGASILV